MSYFPGFSGKKLQLINTLKNTIYRTHRISTENNVTSRFWSYKIGIEYLTNVIKLHLRLYRNGKIVIFIYRKTHVKSLFIDTFCKKTKCSPYICCNPLHSLKPQEANEFYI